MNKLLIFLIASVIGWSSPAVRAAEASPLTERSIQERLEDIEAYINNGARNANTTSRIVAMSFCEPRSWTRVLSS